MKKVICLLLFVGFIILNACSSKNNKAESESMIATLDSTDAHGVQRMQTSESAIDIKFKGKEYHSSVSRMPDETLPHVTNELGDTYLDNKIVVRLTCGGEHVFDKTFTKSDFASVVDAEFLRKSVLEGIVYDKTTADGIVYAASVCYPQTDLYVPLSITITADGKMSIGKVENLEDTYGEDTD